MNEPSKHPGQEINDSLRLLVHSWCDRRELGALANVLPAFLANNGLTDGWGELMEALRLERSLRRLPDHERDEVERLVVSLERMVYRTG